MKYEFTCVVICAALQGCAFNVTLMGRDTGQTFSGELIGNGGGSGTMNVSMGTNVCTGPAARVHSNESFGFATTYARNNRGQVGTAVTNTYSSGDTFVKALLSCTNGSGLRCDLSGSGASAGGICVDDQGKVYDVIAARK